jgi:hypothetical protein
MRRGHLQLAAVLLAVAAGPMAQAGDAATSPSFAGSCDFHGKVRFSPALTGAPQPGRGRATATGACTGTVTDAHGQAHEVTSAPARYRAWNASDTMGCAGGPAEGAGRLVIGHTKLRFRLTEARAVAVSALQLAGDAWSGDGVANIDPQTDPVDAVQRCGADGIRSVPIDLTLRARAS